MGELYDLNARLRKVEERVESGGEPPDNGDMEARVSKLESIAEKTSERLAAIDKDLAVMKSNYATREDVQSAKTVVAEAKNSVIMWVVGAIFIAQILPALPGILRSLGLLK